MGRFCRAELRARTFCSNLRSLETLHSKTLHAFLDNRYSYKFTMADNEQRSSKRSRFDQTEPEVKRSSRYDRRSRSPSRRDSETKRSRSPVAQKSPFSSGSEEKKTAFDPAAAAGKSDRSCVTGRTNTFHSGRRSSHQCSNTS